MNKPQMFRRTELDALLRFIEANAEARGERSTYLMPSDVVWRLPGAQRLYEFCGFERIDTMRTYLKRID